MSPSVAQAKLMAQRDNEIVALVCLPSGKVLSFSEPLDTGVILMDEDSFGLAVVGLTAQVNYTLLRRAA